MPAAVGVALTSKGLGPMPTVKRSTKYCGKVCGK